MTPAALMWGVLFGALGAGYLVYGRKQRALVPFGSGLLLIVAPYFIANTVALVAGCLAVAALPFVFKR